jgi:flavin-dependent dehydrogenase
MFLGAGAAWHLDRVALERSLVEAAISRTAHFETGQIAGCRETGNGLTVSVKTGAVLSARYAIDATGRTAALSRMMGTRPMILDRLVGCVAYTRDDQVERNELMVESFADGWWYTASLPHGRRVVACMTDADQIRSLGLGSPDGYRALLARTLYIGAVRDHDAPLDGLQIYPANSRRTTIRADLPLLPAGDAAFTVDPVCGQGIVNALRSGVYAAYAVADWLQTNDERKLRRYRTWLEAAHAVYRTDLRACYATEARWSHHPFWRRRQA